MCFAHAPRDGVVGLEVLHHTRVCLQDVFLCLVWHIQIPCRRIMRSMSRRNDVVLSAYHLVLRRCRTGAGRNDPAVDVSCCLRCPGLEMVFPRQVVNIDACTSTNVLLPW